MNSTSIDIRNSLLSALQKKYESEISMGVATLKVYLNNPVAIGEHPQHIEEMDKLLDSIASAQDKLDNLNKHFSIIECLTNQ